MVVVLGVTELGCRQANDLGTYCILVRRNPADPPGTISSIPVRQGELPVTSGPTSSQRDYISFGSTECENLVCVRDATFSEANEPGLSVGANFPAYGVCSRPCTPSAQALCQAADSAIDKNPRTHLSCRQLVLDEATLAHLQQTDPVRYQQYFGTNTSPFFCARGTEPTP
jgi:hypothetical protein